jgi:hypothetical protein
VKKPLNPQTRKRRPARIVCLEGLALRKAVAGGAGRLLLGERLEPPDPGDSTRDQSPEGGGRNLTHLGGL